MRVTMTYDFQQDLAKYGPQTMAVPITLRQARRYCRRFTRKNYENFTVASMLLPRRLKQHFYHVYAYCRWADNLADEAGNTGQSLALLGWWEMHLRECFRGKAVHPVFIALRETIERFAVPLEPFIDLLVAFRQDQRVTRYESFDQLLEYCRYSANPVGRLVLYLGESATPDRFHDSDSICTGLQLINFCQDVARDFERGRVYLPQVECRRYGYTEAMFAARECNDAFRRLLAAQVDQAEGFLRSGLRLADRVPPALKLDIALFVHGGLAVAKAIRRQDFDVWSRRPTVSKTERIGILASCWWRLKTAKKPSPETETARR